MGHLDGENVDDYLEKISRSTMRPLLYGNGACVISAPELYTLIQHIYLIQIKYYFAQPQLMARPQYNLLH